MQLFSVRQLEKKNAKPLIYIYISTLTSINHNNRRYIEGERERNNTDYMNDVLRLEIFHKTDKI